MAERLKLATRIALIRVTDLRLIIIAMVIGSIGDVIAGGSMPGGLIGAKILSHSFESFIFLSLLLIPIML